MSPAPGTARTMRVVLQITDGPDLGRKILLRSRHELKVGRTSWADFVCEHDSKMSRVHFKVVTDSVGCYLEDLQSSNGTLLNGQKVETERLKHGDRIRAGNTTFIVQIEGDRPNLTGSYVGAPPADGTKPKKKSKQQVLYGKKQCASGLIQYSIAADDLPPATFAEELSKTWPLFLMADFNRMGGQRPEDLTKAELLFDWLDPIVAQEYPVFFAQHDTAETFNLLAEFFAADALVCVFSKEKREAMLEHLKLCSRTRLHTEDDSGGMCGICWPSVLGAMLPSSDPSFIDRLTSGMEAILLYLPDSPEQGLLFGDESIEMLLQAWGYQLDPASVEAEADGEQESDETVPG